MNYKKPSEFDCVYPRKEDGVQPSELNTLLDLLDSAKNKLLTTVENHKKQGGIVHLTAVDAIEFSIQIYDLAILRFKQQI